MLAVALLLATGTQTLDAMVKAATTCPPARPNEITVCGNRERERSRYLSPLPPEPEVGDPLARSVARERYDLLDHDGSGAGSCSAAGANGMFGCGFKKHKAWATQRAGARDPRGPLYDK